MQIWRQAKNYSQKKGQALGWIVTLTRRRAIDRLRKRQAYHRVTERLEMETEHQPEAWQHNRIEDDILHDDLRQFLRQRIEALPALPAPGHRSRLLQGDEPAGDRHSHQHPAGHHQDPPGTGPAQALRLHPRPAGIRFDPNRLGGR